MTVSRTLQDIPSAQIRYIVYHYSELLPHHRPGLIVERASQKVKVPVLIVHAEDDFDISHTHSDALFDALLDPFLPSVDPLPRDPGSWTKEQWSTYQTQMATKWEVRERLLNRTDIPHFGVMDTFSASGETVVLLKTLTGSHNDVGAWEGTHEVIRKLFLLA